MFACINSMPIQAATNKNLIISVTASLIAYVPVGNSFIILAKIPETISQSTGCYIGNPSNDY